MKNYIAAIAMLSGLMRQDKPRHTRNTYQKKFNRRKDKIKNKGAFGSGPAGSRIAQYRERMG